MRRKPEPGGAPALLPASIAVARRQYAGESRRVPGRGPAASQSDEMVRPNASENETLLGKELPVGVRLKQQS